MQRAYGVDQPAYGWLVEGMRVAEGDQSIPAHCAIPGHIGLPSSQTTFTNTFLRDVGCRVLWELLRHLRRRLDFLDRVLYPVSRHS